jgi:hypothetical protein
MPEVLRAYLDLCYASARDMLADPELTDAERVGQLVGMFKDCQRLLCMSRVRPHDIGVY